MLPVAWLRHRVRHGHACWPSQQQISLEWRPCNCGTATCMAAARPSCPPEKTFQRGMAVAWLHPATLSVMGLQRGQGCQPGAKLSVMWGGPAPKAAQPWHSCCKATPADDKTAFHGSPGARWQCGHGTAAARPAGQPQHCTIEDLGVRVSHQRLCCATSTPAGGSTTHALWSYNIAAAWPRHDFSTAMPLRATTGSHRSLAARL